MLVADGKPRQLFATVLLHAHSYKICGPKILFLMTGDQLRGTGSLDPGSERMCDHVCWATGKLKVVCKYGVVNDHETSRHAVHASACCGCNRNAACR